jgi:hypothetical protein
MDAFDDTVQRLQRDLDNLKQLRPQIGRNGNGDGNGDEEEPPLPNANLHIAGIEVTQGIQFFNFNGRGSGAAPDNSMPLVAKKTTVVRVYVDRRTSPSFPIPSTITGYCRAVQHVGSQQSLVASLPPMNTAITARAGNQINRGNANDTLNFRLDGWLCTGTMHFVVVVWDSTRSPGDADFVAFASDTFQTPTFTFVQEPITASPLSIRLFVVRIIYTGPNANGQPTRIDPPSENDVINTLSQSFVSQTYPISGIDYNGSITAEFNGDLRVDGTGCGMGWGALIDILQQQRAASGSGDVVLGLLPSPPAPAPQVPSGNVLGCASYDGVAAAFAGDSTTVAQEVGHAYGRKHAPCGSPSDVDTSYPAFTLSDGTVLPSGSIGEWGFDTTLSTLRNPATTFDFMSYCAPAWVSPYTYRALLSAIYLRSIMFPSAAAPVATQEASVERDYLYLNFRMYRDGRVELLPGFHLSGFPSVPETEDGPQSPVVFELRDAERRVLGLHRCHFTDPYVDPDSPFHDFHKMVPWEPETTSIAFLRDGDEVQIIEVEERAPQITSRPVAEREGDRVRLAWEAQHDENRITYLVRYSNDGGNTWLAVGTGLTEPGFVADLADLPGGERCVFQIAASSTIRTTVAQTSAMAVPVKPRRPYILSPEPNSRFSQGEPVVLGGVGFSPDFQTAPLDEVVWTSNVDGFLGYGYEVITHTLTPGLHKITLGVADGLGGEASESLLIKIQRQE